jgi:hypothetical protein
LTIHEIGELRIPAKLITGHCSFAADALWHPTRVIENLRQHNSEDPCGVNRAKGTYIRLHDLHDTHASLLGKHGVPLEVISKRLGHATIGITAVICTSIKNETPRRRLCSNSSPAKASR